MISETLPKINNWQLAHLGSQHAERYIQPSDCIFFSLSQQDSTKLHTVSNTAWPCSRRLQVLNWSACSPDFSLIENILRIVKQDATQ